MPPGINTGTIAVVLLIATGTTVIVLGLPRMKTATMVLGGLYMLYLAWRIATAPPVGSGEQGSHRPSLLGGFALAIANPKAYGAIGSLYVGSLVEAEQGAYTTAAKVLVLAIVAVTVNTTWLAFGAAIAAALRDPRKARIANIVFALLLLLSLAPLLLSSPLER